MCLDSYSLGILIEWKQASPKPQPLMAAEIPTR